jgi:predicted dehydrogenase
MRKVNWGIISTANIGLNHVIPGMQKGKFSNIMAISSRNSATAEKAAEDLGIAKAYGSYEELLADDEIEAVYNPLPNHLHVPMTIKALKAGKHVLCEKPIALNAKEAEELLEVTKKYPDLKVIEAFMYRFHPQWEEVKKWIKEDEIGDIKTIQSAFTYFNDNPEDIRNKADIGGGGLMDIGCYCISASRYLMESEPTKVYGEIERDPEFGTDILTSGILTFSKGTASFICSTQSSPRQSLTVYGTDGLIEMEIPFNPLENETTITLKKDGEVIMSKKLQANHYTLQGDHFSKAILENKSVPTPLKDALNNMKVIDGIFESSEKEVPITL